VKRFVAASVFCALLFIVLFGRAGFAPQRLTYAAQPTLQPTETASPLVTATPLPPFTTAPLPTIDWTDVSVHKMAMKPTFAADVDSFIKANRYLIVAELRFEPDAVIRAAQRVHFTNRTGIPLDVIVFRLYPNTPALGGRMTVDNVTVNGIPVKPSFAELNSVMGIPLALPLQPNESVEMTMTFGVILSRGLGTSYGRFGYQNQVVSATAWYPTLSVFDQKTGWWVDLPSPQGDPGYSESGLYDVRLTVPKEVAVAMSGTIVETTENAENTVTYRDVTGPMRDHAFQASPRYGIKAVTVDGTTINIVHYKDLLAEKTNGTDEAAEWALNSVKTFNATFGEYPYRELDIVQNPTPSGVEFPGLVQIAERSWMRGNPYLEIVIAHEIGHQWFYGLIGNDQVNHPWLDESLTSYTEFVYMRTIYPEGTQAQDYINNFQRAYTGYVGSGSLDLPLDLPVRRYVGGGYGAIVYRKGPLFYIELERLLGQETVYKALWTYFHRYKYQIVFSPDVKKVFEEISGQDLTEVFEKWVGGFASPAANEGGKEG